MNEAASISVLPEGCLSEILSLTSPRDVCRAASISKGFNTAADSDPVWERFLPPDYREIIGRAVSPVVVFGSKKQLYFSLSDSHIILDHAYLVNRSSYFLFHFQTVLFNLSCPIIWKFPQKSTHEVWNFFFRIRYYLYYGYHCLNLMRTATKIYTFE